MFFTRLGEWARAIKRDVVALWLAARDPRTPLAAKIIAATTAAYALSPIDLIPDFIPVLGYLDDLLIVPAGIWLAVHLMPKQLMAELRTAAQALEKPRSLTGAAVILAIWLALLAMAFLWWSGA